MIWTSVQCAPLNETASRHLREGGEGKPLTAANQATTLPKPETTFDGSALASYTGGNGGYGGSDGSMVQPNQPPEQNYGSGVSIPCPLCVINGRK